MIQNSLLEGIYLLYYRGFVFYWFDCFMKYEFFRLWIVFFGFFGSYWM